MMKNIKKFFTSKITLAALACLLLVGIFAGITILATESTPALALKSVELNHDATPSIKYDVTASNLSGAIVDNLDRYEMRFWTNEPASATAGGYNDVATVANSRVTFADDYANGEQTISFYSRGFAAKEMTDVVYAAAVYLDEDGNVAAATQVKRYSVFEYLCEAGYNATGAQAELYSALKDYITYAQQYLGYTDSASPADLAYIKVDNGVLYLKNGYDEASKQNLYDETRPYTSAALLAGTTIKIVADYDLAIIVRADMDDTIMTNAAENYYECGVVAGSDRHYVAYPASNVTFTVPAGLEIVKLKANRLDVEYSYIRESFIDSEGTYKVGQGVNGEKYVLTAPLYDADGTMFAYWADAKGTPVSYDALYDVSALVDFDKTEQAVAIDLAPVYENIAPDRYNTFYTAAQNSGATYDITTNLEDGTGMILDSSSRPAGQNPSGKGFTSTGVNSAAKLPNGPSRAIYSFNINLEAHDITDYTDATMGNFFSVPTNNCVYQMRLGYNDGSQSIGYFQFFVETANKGNLASPVTGYRLNIAANGQNLKSYDFNQDSRMFMEFGVENNITVIYEFDSDANNAAQTAMHVYINGFYAGTAQVRPDNAPAGAAYAAKLWMNLTALMRTKAKVTITDAFFAEFE